MFVQVNKNNLILTARQMTNKDARTEVGTKALMVAAFNGHVGVASLLIKKGANINAKTSEGRTPLMIAAYRGLPKLTELFINSGANIHHTDNQGFTAYDWAVKRNHYHVANMIGMDRKII